MSDEFKYDVFLGHASADKAAVRELALRPKADGLCVNPKVKGGTMKVEFDRHPSTFGLHPSQRPINQQSRFIRYVTHETGFGSS